MALGRGRILVPGFTRSPPTLAVYDVAHSLPLGGVGRDFPFIEDETQGHFSYLSDILESFSMNELKIKFSLPNKIPPRHQVFNHLESFHAEGISILHVSEVISN